jgi:hypothetical protein
VLIASQLVHVVTLKGFPAETAIVSRVRSCSACCNGTSLGTSIDSRISAVSCPVCCRRQWLVKHLWQKVAHRVAAHRAAVSPASRRLDVRLWPPSRSPSLQVCGAHACVCSPVGSSLDVRAGEGRSLSATGPTASTPERSLVAWRCLCRHALSRAVFCADIMTSSEDGHGLSSSSRRELLARAAAARFAPASS